MGGIGGGRWRGTVETMGSEEMVWALSHGTGRLESDTQMIRTFFPSHQHTENPRSCVLTVSVSSSIELAPFHPHHDSSTKTVPFPTPKPLAPTGLPTLT